ncbi:MAG: PIN domain-containing protein [Thaumarchaeota archaeon]|nr:PIN domain-containing protein [Nitrososphaerota archaeon]
MLFETDVLLAALNPNDPLNSPARKVMEQDALLLSPFSLLEVNLLARAGKLEILNFDDFARDLSALLEASSIRILNDRAEYHSEARRFELEFELTFFDSLHGAVSKVKKETIVSFDRTYDKLSKAGVRRLDPKEI